MPQIAWKQLFCPRLLLYLADKRCRWGSQKLDVKWSELPFYLVDLWMYVWYCTIQHFHFTNNLVSNHTNNKLIMEYAEFFPCDSFRCCIARAPSPGSLSSDETEITSGQASTRGVGQIGTNLLWLGLGHLRIRVFRKVRKTGIPC